HRRILQDLSEAYPNLNLDYLVPRTAVEQRIVVLKRMLAEKSELVTEFVKTNLRTIIRDYQKGKIKHKIGICYLYFAGRKVKGPLKTENFLYTETVEALNYDRSKGGFWLEK